MTERRMALVASPTAAAQAAAEELRGLYEWYPIERADLVIALGGDGYMLRTLHSMLDRHRILPIFGMNLGTVGFLMNEWKPELLELRVQNAKSMTVLPLRMDAVTVDGERFSIPAINEVSLLRETRETAKLEVIVDGRVVLPELVCDGVLVATPAGSTAYNLSAQGPILPLDSSLLALTPISPFRPRRWRGAILPESAKVSFTVREPDKRPVAAVADQKEVRDVAEVHITTARDHRLTLLFDPGKTLEERIFAEQFQA